MEAADRATPFIYPAATAKDFRYLPPERQKATLEILNTCLAARLSVRCQKADHDFVIVIGRGYPSAAHWLGVFNPR
jgi:hypothetical protein